MTWPPTSTTVPDWTAPNGQRTSPRTSTSITLVFKSPRSLPIRRPLLNYLVASSRYSVLGPLGLGDTILGINNCVQMHGSKWAKILRGGLPPCRSLAAQNHPRQLSGELSATFDPPGLGDTILWHVNNGVQTHSPKRAKILCGARSTLSLVYGGNLPQGLSPKSKAPNLTVNLNHGSRSDGHVSPRAPLY